MSENPLTNGMGWVAATLLTGDTERENRPEQESAGAMLARMGTDAQVWADEFYAIHRRIVNEGGDTKGLLADEGTVIGWFANAIEAGRTAGAQQRCPHLFKDLFITGDLILCGLCGKGLTYGHGPDLPEVAPELITALGELFDEYGPLGVVQVAATMQSATSAYYDEHKREAPDG